MTRKPGSAAITPPKPYSEAVFIEASRAPATAALLPSAKRAITGFQASASTARMPSSRAASTAQIAFTFATSVMTGFAPSSTISCVLPYSRGMSLVNTRLATPTTTSGLSATHGFGRSVASKASGSLRRSVP